MLFTFYKLVHISLPWVCCCFQNYFIVSWKILLLWFFVDVYYFNKFGRVFGFYSLLFPLKVRVIYFIYFCYCLSFPRLFDLKLSVSNLDELFTIQLETKLTCYINYKIKENINYSQLLHGNNTLYHQPANEGHSLQP